MRSLTRIAAAVALVSAGAHIVLALASSGLSLLDRLVLMAMATACAICVPALLRSPTQRTWVGLVSMYALMALAHPLLDHGVGAVHRAAMPVHGVMGDMENDTSPPWDQLYAAVHLAPYLQFVLGGVALTRLWQRRHSSSRPAVITAPCAVSVPLERRTSQPEG